MSLAAKVLIADDDQALARTLMWLLTENGYHATLLPSKAELLEHLEADQYDLLLLDLGLPLADEMDLLERIKRDPKHKDLPILMVSSSPPEETTVRALGLGAADFIAKPFRVRELLARVKAHLRLGRELNQARAEARSHLEMVAILREITTSLKPDEIFTVLVRRVAQGLKISRCSILLADADAGTAVATVVAAFENPMLRNLRVELRRYPEIRRALDSGDPVLIQNIGSDPLLEDTRAEWKANGQLVPTTSALALPFRLRGNRSGVFFLRTSGDDAPLNQQDLQFADQVIKSALASIEKAYDLESAMVRQEQMRLLAETDPLTGLLNRRALSDKLQQEVERAARYGAVVTCIILDIDHFKLTNDTFGHQMGDRVLSQLGALLRREQRAVDIVARFGGEEFVVLLPETGNTGARIFADRILRRIGDHVFGDSSRPITVTVSAGLATYPDERVTDGESLLRLADGNLLKAKSDGRNRYRD